MTTDLDVRQAEERVRILAPVPGENPTVTERLASDFLALAALARRLAEKMVTDHDPCSPLKCDSSELLAEARRAGLLGEE